MNKFKVILILFCTICFGQKVNVAQNLESKVESVEFSMNSISDPVPRKLSYQGLLTKANGRAIGDGVYQITFKLYRQYQGGNAFWEEAQSVEINDGVVSATLGMSVPIAEIPSSAYLEIDIDGTTLSPRQEMTSVFYSVVSDTAKFSESANYSDPVSYTHLTLPTKRIV